MALQNSGNVKFFKNTITSGAHGISIQGTTASKFYENTFTTMAQAIAINGQVSGNEFYKNSIKTGADGININDASNNKFYENLIQDMTGNAITVGSLSTTNKFYKNDFIHNNPTGKQATSSSSADTWYDTTTNKGNFWSDWTSPDANSDGVVDLPYALAGSAATDNYPVTTPVAGGVVVQPLAVAFASDKTTGTAPILITFTVTPSGGTAPYTTNITYGDGKNGADLGHTYYQGGTFVASVLIKDNQGATKTSTSITLTIIAPLNVTVTSTTSTGKAPLAVGFTSTAKGGVGPYNYTWDFGDGTAKSYEANPTHVFKNTGSYSVKLTVKDSKGTTETATKNIIAIKVSKPEGFIPGFEALILIVVVLAALVIVGRKKN
jgi:parallel beta-helix repeat protein